MGGEVVKKDDFAVYDPIVTKVHETVSKGKNKFQQAEMAAWWCDAFILRLAGLHNSGEAFNSIGFDPDFLRILKNQADVAYSIATQKIRNKSPDTILKAALEVAYCLLSVSSNLFEDEDDDDGYEFGIRSVYCQMLRQTSQALTARPVDSRLRLMLQGVLESVTIQTLFES